MVSLTGALTVASSGVVEADVRARAVVIEGRVLGNIIADDRSRFAPRVASKATSSAPRSPSTRARTSAATST